MILVAREIQMKQEVANSNRKWRKSRHVAGINLKNTPSKTYRIWYIHTEEKKKYFFYLFSDLPGVDAIDISSHITQASIPPTAPLAKRIRTRDRRITTNLGSKVAPNNFRLGLPGWVNAIRNHSLFLLSQFPNFWINKVLFYSILWWTRTHRLRRYLFI